MSLATKNTFLRLLAWAALLVWLLLPLSFPLHAQPLADASSAARNALARHRDANQLLSISAEGRALYERETVKLDGYAYCGRSIALSEQGEFRQSIRAAAKALHVGTTTDNDDLRSLAQRDLAIAYSYAGLLGDAERFAQGALSLTPRKPEQAHAPSHKVLGDVAARRAKFGDAAEHYQRSLALATPKFRPLVMVSLANAYTAAGRPREALEQLQALLPDDARKLGAFHERSVANALLASQQLDAALAAFKRIADASNTPDAAYHRLWATEGMARVHLQRGDKAAALASYLAAVNIAEGLRAKFQSEEFKTGLFGNVQGIFDAALGLSLATRDYNAAWVLSEASRARQLLDNVRERASDSFTGQRVTLAQLQKPLSAGDAVLQFHVMDKQSIVWLVTRAAVQAEVLPMGEAQLARQVEAFRASVIERRRDTAALAAALYKQLVPPKLDLAAQHLYIVPHGPLHYLPFQALHDGRGYLIERSALAVWPSAAVGTQLLARGNAPAPSLLGMGNPSTDRQVPLPGAEREVRQVASLFSRSDVFVREQATKERFKAGAAKASLVHVAAHAELDDVDPLFSRILFASTATESGLLEAREIYAMDLRGTRLITLSACESGLGRVARGDEIVGFTRSLLSAGASSIVASLWPVADESTDLLMGRLYGELASGRGLMDSMRSAQLDVQKDKRFAHPFFWAPFNVIGHGGLVVAGAPP